MLSFVTLVAYDFRLSFEAIKSYYPIADEIILGIDRDRVSFSNNVFPFDSEDFYRGIDEIDQDKKINIVEENFHSYANPLMNEHFERLTLTSMTKQDNWVIQIDSDEVLINPFEFRNWIEKAPDYNGIKAKWVTVYKRFGDDYLIINEEGGFIPVGTKDRSKYVSNREVAQPYLISPLVLLHHAYGRSREEVELKIKNWGHSQDIDVKNMLATWDYANLDTYSEIHNFHPLHPPWWKSLQHVRVTSGG